MPQTQLATAARSSRAEQIAGLGGLAIDSDRRGDTHTIFLSGELELVTNRDVERELRIVEEGDAASIVLDLSGVSFIDSSGIRMLLLARARTRDDGDRLKLRRPPGRVFEVLQVCGVDRLLPFLD
jgi:anti-anti-sigma factor